MAGEFWLRQWAMGAATALFPNKLRGVPRVYDWRVIPRWRGFEGGAGDFMKKGVNGRWKDTL